MSAQAFDRRRVNGPEVSFPPVFDDEPPVASTSASATAIQHDLQKAAESYARQRRDKDALRPICERGLIPSPNDALERAWRRRSADLTRLSASSARCVQSLRRV